VIDPEFQIAFIASDCDWRKTFCAFVLEEANDSFRSLQALRSTVHEKISFFGDSSNQKPPGSLFLQSLAVFD